MGTGFNIDLARTGARRLLVRMACVLSLLVAGMAAASAQDWNYRIRPGDTLWDLSGEYLKPDVSWQRLQAHNRIGNPYQLPPGSILRFPLAWLHIQPAKARIIAVQGDATLLTLGQEVETTAVEGMELGIGTSLRTAKDATLSLEFADGTRMLLMGESELHLDRMSRYGKRGMVDTRLRLQRGRISNTVTPTRGVAPGFIVDTPNASSAVRGTRFRVEAAEAGTQTEVVEGSVSVSNPAHSALVRRGFGTVVAAGQATAIRAVPLLPAPDLSALPAKIEDARAQLQWPVVANAVHYRLQASSTATFDTLLVDLETADSRATLPALQDGHYFLRLRAVDAQGLEGRDATASFTLQALPEPPFTIAPAADAVVREAQPEFSWSNSTEAAGYRFQLARDPAFTDAVATLSPSSARPMRVQQTLAPGTYYWRVASNSHDGRQGHYGDAVAFTLRPLPEAGEIGNEKQGRAVTFRWRAGEPGQKYRFQLSRSPDFDKLRLDEVVGQSQITVPKLRPGTWYLRAQAIGTDGHQGAFPPAQSVQVPCGACKAIVAGGMLWILLAL